MSLPPEQAASYGAIIDLILQKSDLNSISAKQVRKELADRLGYDVSAKKDAINQLIGQRFDKINSGTNGNVKQEVNGDATGGAELVPPANGVVKSIEKASTPPSPPSRSVQKSPPKRHAPSNDDDDSELSEPIDVPQPKKKRKQTTAEEDDAAFAARLQDEENRRGRPTRGGATRKRPSTKKEKGAGKKKKSAAKVKADDDSDLSSPVEEDKKERKGGFHKLMALSQPLSELLGETELSRPQTVKKIWAYVKERDLQDPKDRRYFVCDEGLRKVFKSDKVHMFTMNKILAQNLYATDE